MHVTTSDSHPHYAGDGDTLEETTLVKDIVSFRAQALAQILVDVMINGNSCSLTIDPCTQVKECVELETSCINENGIVLTCCDPEHVCMRQSFEEDSAATCQSPPRPGFGPEPVILEPASCGSAK